MEELQHELEQWTEAADHACEFTPSDAPVATEETPSFVAEQTSVAVEVAQEAPQMMEKVSATSAQTPQVEQQISEPSDTAIIITEDLPQISDEKVENPVAMVEVGADTLPTKETVVEEATEEVATPQMPAEQTEENTAETPKEANNTAESVHVVRINDKMLQHLPTPRCLLPNRATALKRQSANSKNKRRSIRKKLVNVK